MATGSRVVPTVVRGFAVVDRLAVERLVVLRALALGALRALAALRGLDAALVALAAGLAAAAVGAAAVGLAVVSFVAIEERAPCGQVFGRTPVSNPALRGRYTRELCEQPFRP